MKDLAKILKRKKRGKNKEDVHDGKTMRDENMIERTEEENTNDDEIYYSDDEEIYYSDDDMNESTEEENLFTKKECQESRCPVCGKVLKNILLHIKKAIKCQNKIEKEVLLKLEAKSKLIRKSNYKVH